MVNRIEIVPATLAHVQAMGGFMNAEDRDEIECLGVKAHRALWRGWKNSNFRHSALVDGELAAMWGVAGSMMGDVGTPWLVTAQKAREVSAHEFAKIYRAEARKMLELYPVLVNYVDNRYTGAVRMLKISGFRLDEPIPLGKFKRLFRRFYLEA